MTLVTIDLGDVAGGHDPDDHVIIRAEAFRESPGGGITSTAEVKIPLVDGVGQAEVEPGPVVVSFRCRAVADTREKRGVVPGTGPVGIERVLENAFEYLPPVVNDALETIQGAVDAAVEDIKWKRGMLPESYANLADVPDGDWIVASASQATGLGLPSPLISRISKHTYGSAVFYLVTTGGANPRIWLRYGNTGEWWKPASAEDIPAPWWRGTSQIPAGEALDSIAVGEYTLWSASHATTLGLPTATQGELTVRAFGNTRTYEWVAFLPDGFQEWKRRINTAGVDTGWVDMTGHGDDPGMEVTPAGMKLVPLALTLGQGSTAASGGAMSGGFRAPIRYNAPITRWRVCFTNRNPRYGAVRNAQSVVSSVVVGAHVDGVYASAPSTVAANLTVSADGSVARTSWQTTPIGDGRDMAISYRYTTSGPEAPPLLVGGGWDLGTSSPSTLNPSKTQVIRLPFDMWIEAETPATTPVIAGFGDSITCGVGATVPVFDSWPNVYARTVGALPMHYSSSGDTFENWSLDEKAYKVSRWDHLARPDAVLWAMGTNDMSSSRTFAQHQANTAKMVEIIRERWSQNLYLATIMPRNNEAAEIKSMRDQWNTWASSQQEFRDTFDFATAVRDPATGGILPAYNADGLHLSSAGSAAQAMAITRPIANHVASELQAADTALGQRIDAEKWHRPPLLPGTDLDTVRQPGAHPIASSADMQSMTNRPPEAGGTAILIVGDAKATIFQELWWWSAGGVRRTAHRVTSSGSFGAWRVGPEPHTHAISEIPGLEAALAPQQMISPGDKYFTVDGRLAPVLTDTSRITGWGSSSLGNMAVEFRDVATTLGASYYNRARGGERIQHIAARMGAVHAIINPVTIPGSGAVAVTSPNLPPEINMLAFTGWLGGVHGTLSSTSSQLTFTRTTAGEAVTLTAPEELITDVDHTLWEAVTIISAGKNNATDTNAVDVVLDYTARMVRHLTPLVPRFLVMGHYFNQDWAPGDVRRDRMAAINAALHTTYGEYFIDHHGILTSPAVWDQAGIVPTQADLDAQAELRLPPSLASDNAHQNAIADLVVTEAVRQRMTDLSWY